MEKKTEVVFLVGLSFSGKDTVGKVFVDNGFTRISYADVLKQEYANLNGIDLKILHEQGPEKELHRPKLIEYAEAARTIDPLHWVSKAFSPYLDETQTFKQLKKGLKLVVTDVRRISDIEFAVGMKEIISIGLDPNISAKLFLIDRPEIKDMDNITHEAIGFLKGVHSTLSFSVIDAIITNNSNLEDLQSKVKRIIESFNF